jgi:hypothetical protein
MGVYLCQAVAGCDLDNAELLPGALRPPAAPGLTRPSGTHSSALPSSVYASFLYNPSVQYLPARLKDVTCTATLRPQA